MVVTSKYSNVVFVLYSCRCINILHNARLISDRVRWLSPDHMARFARSFFRFCGRRKNGLRPQKRPDFGMVSVGILSVCS